MTTFQLNGKMVSVDLRPGTTLLDYLRDQGFFSVKYGSDKGETGADSVLVDGKIMNASLMLIHTINGKNVETVESFATGQDVHPLQDAFIEEGAIQCGYCTPGMILAVESLARENESPSTDDIKDVLAGVYCRCTGYVKPVKAAINYLASKNGDTR
ncbi:MAG: (2Fe-2S)-binding protein [Fidelibacterota bacterium]